MKKVSSVKCQDSRKPRRAPKVCNSPTIMAVFERIAWERVRQEELRRTGRFAATCAEPRLCPDAKLRVLVEEVGEVAEAIDHLAQLNLGCPAWAKQREHLRAELVQVAAVAVAWLQSMEPEVRSQKSEAKEDAK